MINYVFDIIEKFGNSTVGDDWYLLVPANEVDGIEQALSEFVNDADGEWLAFDMQPIMNDTGYILRLYSAY